MKYCYIRNGKLTETSYTLFPKFSAESRTLDAEGNEIIIPAVDGLSYDEVVETEIEGRVVYENGEIIPYEGSEEQKIDLQKENESLINAKLWRKGEIVKRLGELRLLREGMAELGQNTSEIDIEISSLKSEYASLESH